jgi:hypothetical protein
MPRGSLLRFRYELKWIDPDLHAELQRNAIKGRAACIAYMNVESGKAIDQVLPVRSAVVVSTVSEGEFLSIELRLEAFACTASAFELCSQLRALKPGLAQWSNVGEIEGHFCVDVRDDLRALRQDVEASGWQVIAKQLSTYGAYSAEPFFYRLDGIREVSTQFTVPFESGSLRLKGGRSYEMRLVHFSPNGLKLEANPKNKDLNWLTIDGDEKAMTFVSSKALATDSNYDLKIVRIRTGLATIQPLDGRISVGRRFVGAEKPDETTWDFDLHARVTPDRWRLMLEGLLIGLPVALQGLVLTYSSTAITDKILVGSLVAVFGFAAGLAASFGLRKA